MKMKTNQAVATDSKGEPRKLNPAQLESIRQTGQFQVRGRLGLLLISLDWLRFEVGFCWGDLMYPQLAFSTLRIVTMCENGHVGQMRMYPTLF